MDFAEPRVSNERKFTRDDLCRFKRAAQGARIRHVEAESGQVPPQCGRLAATGGIQWNVELALISLFDIPVGLTMPHNNEVHAAPQATKCRSSTCSTLNRGSPAEISCW